MNNLKGKIGLEIHTYLTTKEKLFCRCNASREKGLKPNINICPICTGQPGAKPMLPNKSAVEKAVMIGIMLGCKINNELPWKRKHYDWPDLPKGYQNTLSGNNAIPVGEKGEFGGIGITEMHLEEDPASWEPSSGNVDYNRSGLALVEIVTDPDFKNASEVIEWLKKLVLNLSYLKCVDSNAGIKVDVNVSIPKKSERAEIKNISSLEDIENAINYEIKRHMEEGNSKRETRRYDSAKGKTIMMRSKEEADDYRFISDPDLKNIVLGKEFIESIRKNIPERPEVKLKKFIKEYKIDEKNALVLTNNIDLVEFFEKVAQKIDGKFALPWVTIELPRVLNYNKAKLSETQIDANHFSSLLKLVKDNKITELQAKQTLNKFYPKSFDPANEVKGKITDEKEIEGFVKKAISNNAKAVSDYKAGDKNSLNFLMGEVMKLSDRRADFMVARKVLEKSLKN